MPRQTPRRVLSTIFIAGFLHNLGFAADWTITDLGTVTGYTWAVATGISPSGRVVGNTVDGPMFLYDGTNRNNWATTSLGFMPGSGSSTAVGISRQGYVAGMGLFDADPNFTRGFLYVAGVWNDVGTLGGDTTSLLAINANGQAVGHSRIAPRGQRHAFIYDLTNGLRDLGVLSFGGSVAVGINGNGQVLGDSSGDDGIGHVVLFDGPGSIRDLFWLGYPSPFPGPSAVVNPVAVNSNGAIVGNAFYVTDLTTGLGYQRAFVYNGTSQELGTLPAPFDATSIVTAINDSGQIVGRSDSIADGGLGGLGAPNARAFLHDGAMRDLSALPEVVAAGWQSLNVANAINNTGQIVGAGSIGGEIHAFRLEPQTTSRYMSTTDPTTLYNLGCKQTNQRGPVVLDFGTPRNRNGVFGTRLIGVLSGVRRFASIAEIEGAVQSFINGYYTCNGSPGRARPLTVAVGTNNVGRGTTRAHGAAWGEMLGRLNSFVASSNFADRVAVVGASDIETGFNTPQKSRAWVDGYVSTSPVGFYNYGDAAGCPRTGNTDCNPGQFVWALDDVWYVSSGPAGAQPLPEIYAPGNAHQWKNLSRYGYAQSARRTPMVFAGTLTTWQACMDVQSNEKICQPPNTPVQGWQLLQDALNADQRTAQDILFSSDITYQN